MQKDIALKQLAEHEDVFAEIFNQLAFGGKQIVIPEELVAIPTEAILTETEGQLREKRRDIVKADRRGNCYHLIFDLENQDRIDYTMPVRIMGYEVASYEKQIREIAAINKKNLEHHVLERLMKGQKLAPVVSLVLYWGRETWDSPRCLHDILELSGEWGDIIKPFIPDHPLNLVCMSNLGEEDRECLKTDIRVLADYVACRKDPQRRSSILRKQSHKIRHPKELLIALAAIAGDHHYKEMLNSWEKKIRQEKRGEEIEMCEVWDAIWGDGRKEGRQEGIKVGIHALIKTCKDFGVSQQETLKRIVDDCTVSQEAAEEYLALYW